jgi:hypothetical protein
LNEKQEILIPHPIEGLVKKTFSGYCPFLTMDRKKELRKRMLNGGIVKNSE